MTSAAGFNNSGRYSSTDIKGLAGGTTSVIFDGEFESTNILKLEAGGGWRKLAE